MTAPEMPSYKSERWLKQMGWEEGKGLGRNEDGMSDYIKVSKKTDSYGIGGSLLTERDRQGFGWWDNLYNKAASSVQVDPTAPAAKTSTVKPMTTNYGAPSFVKAEDKYQTLADKKAKDEAAKEEDKEVKPQQKSQLYGGAFVSGGAFVLGSIKDGTSDSSDSDSDDSSDEEKNYASGLDENDLLAVCGGRILSQWKYPAQGRAKRLAEHERQWKENRDREQALEKEKALKGEAEAKTSNDKTKEEDKATSEDEEQAKKEKKRKRKEKKEKKARKEKKEELEAKVSKKRKREEEEEDEEPEEKEEKKLKKKKSTKKSKKGKTSDDDTKADKKKKDKKDKKDKKKDKKKSKKGKKDKSE